MRTVRAEWVAWQLLDAGLQVELDDWDWSAGDNLTLEVHLRDWTDELRRR
ncbi:hypothetical protein [Streptomyces sp. NPDC017991]